jgi:hypothetical protein
MAFLLDKDCLEAALKEMSDSSVLTIEPLCVDSIEELHPTRQTGSRRFDEQVVVIGHQAVGITDPTIPGDYIAENL